MSGKDETWQRAFGHMKLKGETERKIHKRLVSYIKLQYPNVRFCTTLDGERFGTYQAEAVRALMWGRGIPDLLIFRPNDAYNGLALEIKLTNVWRKDGKLKGGTHLKEQADWLRYFSRIGWAAVFGCGYDTCQDMVDDYLTNNFKNYETHE